MVALGPGFLAGSIAPGCPGPKVRCCCAPHWNTSLGPGTGHPTDSRICPGMQLGTRMSGGSWVTPLRSWRGAQGLVSQGVEALVADSGGPGHGRVDSQSHR